MVSKLWDIFRQVMIVLLLAPISYRLGNVIGGYGVSWFLWGWGIFIVSSLAISRLIKRYRGVRVAERLQTIVALLTLLGYIIYAIADPQSFDNSLYMVIMCVAAPFAIIAVFLLFPILTAGAPRIKPTVSDDELQRDADEKRGWR